MENNYTLHVSLSNLSIQVDSPRKLNSKELTCLRENLEGQIFDGIGSSALNELGRHANLQIIGCTQVAESSR